MSKLILRTTILFLMGLTLLRGQVSTDVQSLKGIQGIAVLVEPLGSDVEAVGLHTSDIQTDVELKLRLAGIKVLTLGESFKEFGSPTYTSAQLSSWVTAAPYTRSLLSLSNTFLSSETDLWFAALRHGTLSLWEWFQPVISNQSDSTLKIRWTSL